MKQTPSTILRNRRARYDYFIDSTIEAGISLFGSEVKSLRLGLGSICDAYACENHGEMFIINSFIPEYKNSRENQFPRRMRKLLLKKKEINKLIGTIKKKGVTLVILSIYSNARGFIKAEIGLARGKREYDKREAEKEKEWKREKISTNVE